MLLMKDECGLCKRVFSSSYLRRCPRCGKLYCFDCTTFTSDGFIICLNCARRAVTPRRLGTKYSPLSRYLLRRATFTESLVLSFSEIEGIIGDNLPSTATRDSDWWKNSRFTAQGRAWIDVGWNVENVNMDNRKATLIRVAKPEIQPEKKTIKKKKTESFKFPLRSTRRRKKVLPSKTHFARAQARIRNIERQRTTGPNYPAGFPKRSAHEKRLFRPEIKPSKASD